MSSLAKTIQIFLPNGDPRGLRIAEITTRIVRVIEIPRSLVNDFLAMPEAKQVGVYFLIGSGDDDDSPMLYVGQSGGVGERIASHNKSKDFWNRALVAVSLTNSLTQTHSLFLEWVSIRDALAAGRYALENGNAGTQPYTPAPLQADCQEIHETVGTLIATLGYPIFTPLSGRGTGGAATDAIERLHATGSGASGLGLYTEEGFVVLAGSKGRRQVVASMKGKPLEKLREQLLSAGVAEIQDEAYVFVKDHLFGSPSTAAGVVNGRATNGWIEWKDKQGRTLDELKRQGS